MQARGTALGPALRNAVSIGAILAAFVCVRLPLLTKDASVRGWNGDDSIMGLMARKILDGRGFDVFYWGQNYMGPLTPVVAAAIRGAVLDPAGLGPGGGPIALRLAGMTEIAFGICLSYLALSRLFGWATGAAAAFWMAAGPPFLVRLTAVPRGPEMSFALGSVLFLLAAGALTRPRPFLDRPGGHFAVGLLGGIAWWMNQTIVFVLVPVAALALARSALPPRGRARFLGRFFAGAALGYSPVWMGRLLGWYEPAAGPYVPPWQLSGLPARLARSLGTDCWRFVGLDGLLPPAILGATALLPLSLLVLRRVRHRPFEGVDLVGAIVGCGALVAFLKNFDPAGDRYLAPVLPSALALLLVSLSEATLPLRRKVPAGYVKLASLGLALLAATFLSRQAQGVVRGVLLEPDPTAPLRTILGEGYRVCHAGYDMAYTLQFLSDERVRFIPYHSPDRNRAQSADLRKVPGPHCLVTDAGDVRMWLPSDAAQEGGPARRRAAKP